MLFTILALVLSSNMQKRPNLRALQLAVPKFILLRPLIGLILVFQVCMGCNRKQIDSKPDIVAQVGDRTITAREFQLNYEFGFSQLKKTPDRNLSSLECMINAA